MRRLIIVSLFMIIACSMNGQTVTGYGNFFKRTNISDRKPIPYPKVREADIIWAKVLWREINLREKINLPLYFPEYPQDGRYSLIDLLLKGIKENKICAFDSEDDEFTVPISHNQVTVNFGAGKDTITRRDPLTGEMENVVVDKHINSSEVKTLLVKELWFFDKQSSTMQVRILGLCPVREFTKEGDEETIYQKKLFWVNYEECRNLLVRYEVFNPYNDALRLSYDDIFVKRRFSSMIKKESNVYNNRPITSYYQGFDAILESERIKNEIFNWEQDLWQY